MQMQVCSINLIFQRRQLIFGFIVGKLMVKWGLHVHTRIHDIMYINGRLQGHIPDL